MKVNLKNVLAAMLIAGLVIMGNGCKKTKLTPTPVLSFQNSALAGLINTTYTNTATSTVAGGGQITYAVDKPSLVTINSSTGTVKALVAGTYTITATQAAVASVNLSATASYVFTAADPLATLAFAKSSYTVAIGSTNNIITATSTVTNGGALTYTIDKPAIATINSSTGLVTPLVAGTATIMATQAPKAGLNQQASTSCTLVVTDALPVLKFATPTSFACVVGSNNTSNTATSSIPSGGAITYATNNANIATVNSSTGVITALAIGTATITATQQAKAGVNQTATLSYALTVQAPALTVTPTALTINYSGVTGGSVAVTSNVSWTASSNQSWCRLAFGGALPATVCDISCTANTSTANRAAVVTISGPGVSSQIVNVTQAGYPTNPYITVTYNGPAGAITGTNIQTGDFNGAQPWNFSISVSSNIYWTVKSDPNAPWCAVSGSGFGNGTIGVSFSTNPTPSVFKTAVIEVVGSMGTPIAYITIVDS